MNLFAVGKIVGYFGVKGYLKILPTTHSLQRFINLSQVYVGSSEHVVARYTVGDVLISHKPLLLKLKEVSNRNDAIKIKDQFIFVEENELLKPKKSEYFVHEIIGCEVWSTDDEFVGMVEEVYKMKAQDIWGIRKAGKLHLIPAVKEFIKKVDTEKKRIVVRLIEGLIEE